MNVCAEGTTGLSYTLIDNDTAYSVSKGTATNEAYIEIPSSYNGKPVKAIANYGFYSCANLVTISIPESITTFGYYAFSISSKLTSISISSNVISIGISAIGFCTSLTNISVSNDNANYLSEDGVLFNKDKTILLQYPAEKQGSSYTIPDGVIIVESVAFYSCKKLTSVIIPSSVTTIDIFSFSHSNITSITIPSSVANIENYAFSNCTNLTCVNMRSMTPAPIKSETFENHNISLKIYVPASSLQAYKSATNWSTYANHIFAYESSTISFNSNGGSGVQSITSDEGSVVVEPTAPTRGICRFGGWFSDTELTHNFVFNVMPNQDITLYAKWFVDISYSYESGVIVREAETGKEYTDSLTQTAQREHQTFLGWTYGGVLVSESTVFDYNNPISFIESFSPTEYEITFNSNGGSEVASISAVFGMLVTEPETPVFGTLDFDGWFKEENFVSKWDFALDTVPDFNTCLYARWIVKVKLVISDNEINSELSKGREYEELFDENISKVGYTLESWIYNNEKITNETEFDYENEIVLSANFEANTYTISFDVNGSPDTIENIVATFDSPIGELATPVKSRYIFKGWFYNQTLFTPDSIYLIDDNITLVAKWEIAPIDFMPTITIIGVIICIMLFSAFIIISKNHTKKVASLKNEIEERAKYNPNLVELEKMFNSKKNSASTNQDSDSSTNLVMPLKNPPTPPHFTPKIPPKFPPKKS
ncbi:MAG: InlB B-repeat-containing protein [Clostridia bacterium]